MAKELKNLTKRADNYSHATELKLEIAEEIKDPAALITLNCLIKEESRFGG